MPLAFIPDFGQNRGGSYLIEDKIYVVDTTTLSVVDEVLVADKPYDVVVHPSRHVAYVVNQGWQFERFAAGGDIFHTKGSVSVIHKTGGVYAEAARLPVGRIPYAGVVVIDGRITHPERLYVSNRQDNTISVIDIEVDDNPTLIGTIELHTTSAVGFGPGRGNDTPNFVDFPGTEIGPKGMATNAAQTLMFVADYFSDEISVIDLATDLETARFFVDVRVPCGPLGLGPWPCLGPRAIIVAKDPVTLNEYIYVANNDGDSVVVFDATFPYAWVTEISLKPPLNPQGVEPRGMVVSPDGHFVFVANYNHGGPGTVSVIATTDVLGLGRTPPYLLEGSYVLAGGVLVDLPIEVGAGPFGMAVVPSSSSLETKLIVTNFGHSKASDGTFSEITYTNNNTFTDPKFSESYRSSALVRVVGDGPAGISPFFIVP